MKKSGLIMGILIGMTMSVSAATISVSLIQQKFSVNGAISNQQIISYNGTTYVPLRKAGELLGAKVDYKDGVIYLGDSSKAPGTTTSKPAAQTVKYSITNPAPVGTSQSVTYDSIMGKHTLQICVKEVLRGEKALKMLDSSFNQPKQGKEFILAKIYVKAASVDDGKKVDISAYSFDCYSNKNAEYESSIIISPDPVLRGSLYSGADIEGWAAFEVDKTDQSPKIGYGQDYDGTGGVWFSLK